MNVILLQSAEEDMEDGWYFYENQEAGVGRQFYEEVMSAVRQLSELHGVHPCKGRFFRALVSKFHAGIYYTTEASAVVVHRIIDLRRDPEWIRSQLGS